MAINAESISIIRARLDPTGYRQGAEAINQANAQMASSGDRVTQSAVRVQRALTDKGSAYERLKRQVDQQYSAQQRLLQVEEIVTRAVNNQRASVEDAARTMTLWRERLMVASQQNEVWAVSNGKAATAMRNLGIQSYDIFSQLAAGAPVMTTFIQQGAQIAQIAQVQGTGLRSFADGLKATFLAINPIALGIGAITLALGALSFMAETTNRQMNALRNTLVGVRPDAQSLAYPIRDAARALSARTNLSVPEAQGLIGTTYQSAIFQGTPDQAAAIAEQFSKLNTVLGKSVDDVSTLKDALDQPSKLLQQLAERDIRGFNFSLVDQAQRLEALGRQDQAFVLILEALKTVTSDVSTNLTPLQEAMRKLDSTFVTLMGNGESLATVLGSKLNNAIASAIGLFDGLINKLAGRNPDGTLHVPEVGSSKGTTPPAEILPLLEAAAQRFDIDPALLRSLQRHEGRFANGEWQTSEAGARGPMQMLPGTFDLMSAKIPGLTNVNDPAQNITAGAGYFAMLLRKYGDPALAVLAYHDGPGRVDAILAGRAQPSEAGLAHARNVTAGYSGTGRYFAPGTASALEPPGPAYVPPTQVPGGPANPGGNAPGAPGPNPGDYGLGENVNKAIEKAREYARAQNLMIDSDDRLTAARSALNVALEDARKRMNTRDIVEYSTALKALEGETYRTVTPQESLVRSFEQQARSAGIVTEADRKLADVRQQLAQLDREHPESATTEEQRARAMSAVLAQQSGAYKVLNFELDLQISQQRKVAEGYLSSTDAGQRAEASVKAFAEATKIAPLGTQQFAAALEALTQKYLDVARAGKEAQFAQQVDAQARQVELLRVENDTLGMNAYQREQLLAKLKAEQELKAAGIPLESQVAQSYLASTDAVLQQTQILQRNQSALQEITGAFTQGFDEIGNAITNSLLSGTGAAINWRNIMTSVAQQVLQAFMKLAVINPLMNELFGQKNPTLGSLFQALEGKGFGGSGENGSGGAGFLGGLFGSIGKLFGLGGGGAAAGLGAVAEPIAVGAEALNAGGVGMFGLLGAIHSGGLVGTDQPTLMRSVSPSVMIGAPRFHDGLNNDEFAAVLQKGERVLTADQSRRVDRVLSSKGEPSAPINVTFNISTPDADSFRRSQGQIMQRAQRGLQQAQRRVGGR